MAAGPRISRLFLLGSPSGREDSERKLGDSAILSGRNPILQQSRSRRVNVLKQRFLFVLESWFFQHDLIFLHIER